MNNYLIPRVTGDIDFFVSRSPDNQKRLRSVLEQFGFGKSLPPPPTELLPQKKILMLGRQPNRIDILAHIDGVNFEEAWEKRVAGSLDQIPVYFIDIHSLLKNKRATGRLKDAADAEGLDKLLSKK